MNNHIMYKVTDKDMRHQIKIFQQKEQRFSLPERERERGREENVSVDMNVNLSLKLATATVSSRHSVSGVFHPSAGWDFETSSWRH